MRLGPRPIMGFQAFELPFEVANFGFEGKDAPNTSEVQTLGRHLRHLGDKLNLELAVAPLTARGPCRLHDAFGIEPAHERGLHAKNVGNLADAEHRRVLVIEADAHPFSRFPLPRWITRGSRPRPNRRWRRWTCHCGDG